jgi:hypothetical protein
MSTTTLASIAMTYRLSISAADLLGADALSTYEDALSAALERAYPDAVVFVDARLARCDESTYRATCTTVDGVELHVWRDGVGRVEIGVDPEALTYAASEAICENFRHADETAWERACEAVEA